MPRQLLKRYLPEPHRIIARRELRWLGKLLEDPFLLHLNRRSVAGGVAVGLFTAFIPLPGQMLIAAALAILLRVNLILSVVLVWVSNPVTMPPMFYLSYMVGTWLIGAPVFHTGFEPSLGWFWHEIGVIWKPLFLGSLTVGGLCALAGYGAIQLAWRLYIVRHLHHRRRRVITRASRRPSSHPRE